MGSDLRPSASAARSGADLRAVAHPLARLLVDAAVIDARRAQPHRARADRNPPLLGAPVAAHQPVSLLVELVDERADVLLDLGLERRRDHPPRALPGQVVERVRDLLVASVVDPANITHGVPSCRPPPASVFINREGTPPSSLRRSTHNIWV